MIKIVIITLLVGVIISLFSDLAFMFKDSEKPDSRRTLHLLGLRITLATALLLTIGYGIYSGDLRLGSGAPWHHPPDDRTADE